jgi:hypothetical protein
MQKITYSKNTLKQNPCLMSIFNIFKALIILFIDIYKILTTIIRIKPLKIYLYFVQDLAGLYGLVFKY